MQSSPESKYFYSGKLKLHYLDFGGEGKTVILSHGLTANAHAFDGLVAAGLSKNIRLISVDLRGRGLSDAGDNYKMQAHAEDMLALLTHLGLKSAIIGGHSFGALLTFYLAAHYPEKVEKMLLLDAAARLHPDTRELLKPTMARLGQVMPSFADYLLKVKSMPFIQNAWEDTMESYYRADVKDLENGGIMPRSKPEDIVMAVEGALGEPWLDYIKGVAHKAILINATGAYGDESAPPLLPKELALETVEMMKNCQYVEVAGNHQTMLYGQGAQEISQAIRQFINT